MTVNEIIAVISASRRKSEERIAFAKRCGISINTLLNWESGKSVPRMYELVKVLEKIDLELTVTPFNRKRIEAAPQGKMRR